MAKKALLYGAGNIGFGFIGWLLDKNGYDLCFADNNEKIITQIRQEKKYTVCLLGQEGTERFLVENVRACLVSSTDLSDEIVAADIITTAIGVGNLKFIVEGLLAGLRKAQAAGRKRPLYIIACENALRASSQLKAKVLEKLSAGEWDMLSSWCVFVDCAVDRVVLQTPHRGEGIEVTTEPFYEWILDGLATAEKLPLEGAKWEDNLDAFIERKLFTLNTGHAITAYLGYRASYATIEESISDPAIASVVEGAMRESAEVLIRRYGFDRGAHETYIKKILGRFLNPHLKDRVDRVGRDPLRKLSAEDRLIKPYRGAVAYNLPRPNLLKGIAAAMSYDYAEDPAATQLQDRLKREGLETVVKDLLGSSAPSGDVKEVCRMVAAYKGQ